MSEQQYPIGTPGQPWGEAEKALWLAKQQVQRSYQTEVLDKLEQLDDSLIKVQYGALSYDLPRYPLYAVKTKSWQAGKPNILITGGVHGYETSGVQGAIRFIQTTLPKYHSQFNFVVLPCISPWGYETINRWNPYALDPNRSFYPESPAPESANAMNYVASLNIKLLAHFDLHETTDSDNSEFRPALAARDGKVNHNWNIPDGFYGVGDTAKPVPEFQKAIIDSVAKVTHIAPADDDGKLIGEPMQQPGVINYDKQSLYLCGGFSGADYVTTTEVYPDSPSATPEICTQAQVAAITGGLDYLIQQR